MLRVRTVLSTVSVVMMVLGVNGAFGQDYPSKPIRVFTSAAGDSGDINLRIIASGISGPLGQPVIIENRPVGVLGQTVAKAPADGYTLLFTSNTFLLAPLTQKAPYDPVKDFTPITAATMAPNLLVVTSSLPAKSVRELIALARARPGELHFSTSATGGSSHLAGELFKALAGINILFVFYRSNSQQYVDLMSGYVQLTITGSASVAGQLKSGKLRALAVTSAKRSALFPGLPALAEAVPGYETTALFGLYAPANTSAPIINRLNQETVRFLNQAEAKEKFLSAGYEVVGNSSEEQAVWVKSYIATWAKVIKDAGIKVQ